MVAAGAAAVAYDASTAPPPADPGIPVVAVDDLAQQLGRIANRYFGAPSETLPVTGVTGSDGKVKIVHNDSFDDDTDIEFCVTNLEKSGYTFDGNVVCDDQEWDD